MCGKPTRGENPNWLGQSSCISISQQTAPTASETHILGTEEFNENFCCGEQWGLTGNPACWNEEPPVGVDRETYRTDLSDVDIAFEADSACNVNQIWMRSSST